MKKLCICLGAALTLASCASQNLLAGVETSDSAALAAIIVYEATPAAKTPAGVALLTQLKSDQLEVDSLLAPLEAAEASGGSLPTTAEVEAVQVAVNTLLALETANNINTGA